MTKKSHERRDQEKKVKMMFASKKALKLYEEPADDDLRLDHHAHPACHDPKMDLPQDERD